MALIEFTHGEPEELAARLFQHTKFRHCHLLPSCRGRYLIFSPPTLSSGHHPSLRLRTDQWIVQLPDSGEEQHRQYGLPGRDGEAETSGNRKIERAEDKKKDDQMQIFNITCEFKQKKF